MSLIFYAARKKNIVRQDYGAFSFELNRTTFTLEPFEVLPTPQPARPRHSLLKNHQSIALIVDGLNLC